MKRGEIAGASLINLIGQPLSELKPLLEVNRVSEAQVVQPEGKPVSGVNPELSVPNHTPASIVFVRNRMLYARAALNAQGGVRFGLRHIRQSPLQSSIHITDVLDVLNRYSEYTKDSHDQPSSNSTSKPHPSTVRIMMYVFPRQFSLHNVFTHDVDHRQTSQALKDYTLREDEINLKYPSDSTVKIPKRLRGKGVALVRKLQIQHNRCPYKKLLEHYCPVSSSYSIGKVIAKFLGIRRNRKERTSQFAVGDSSIYFDDIQHGGLDRHILGNNVIRPRSNSSKKPLVNGPCNTYRPSLGFLPGCSLQSHSP